MSSLHVVVVVVVVVGGGGAFADSNACFSSPPKP
jgi:hypothetical protein